MNRDEEKSAQWLYILLKPLMRFALRRGLAYQQINEAAKRALVEVAAEDLVKNGESGNISRISVLTGLQRRDIKRVQSANTSPEAATTLATKIVGQWLSHPSFSNNTKGPKPLTTTGTDSQFAELVRSVTQDVSPYTVLFGLEKSGLVTRRGELVELVKSGYTVPENAVESISMLALDADDLIRAVEENIFSRQNIPNLHVTTTFDNICIDEVEAIRDWLLDTGSTFHEAARQHLSTLDKDANPRLFARAGGARVSLCTFSITEMAEGTIKGGRDEK